MNIVIDTNVFLSAFLTEGLSYKVFSHCISSHSLFISPWLEAEIIEKFKNKFNVPDDKLKKTEHFIKENFTQILPFGKKPRKCRDVDDNNILWLGISCKADIIISGDKDLLILKEFQNVKILSPREFYNLYMI